MRSITLNVSRRDDARLQTQIDVTNEHIDLIATSEQLSSLSQRGTTLYSQLEVTASGIESKVGRNEIFSVINQAADSLKIEGKKLDLNGNTYANGNFVVNVDGSVEITGKVTASSGTIAGFEIQPTFLRKLSSLTLNNGVAQTQYAVVIRAPQPATENELALRVTHRNYDGASTYTGWTNDFTVSYGGAVTGNNITITGGGAGGFTLGSTFIRKQVDSSNVRYEVSLYAPESPVTSGDNATNAITVRHGAITDGAVPSSAWVNDFTVKYDGSVNCVSETESSLIKRITLHKGRIKYYSGSAGNTWIGEWACGTYSESNFNTRNAIYLAAHANNVVGFATQSASGGTGTPYFYYNPNHKAMFFKSPLESVNLNDQVNLVNAIRVSAQEFYVYSGTKGYCMHGLNDTTNYYQVKYNSATNLGLYVNGGTTATFVVTTSSSDKRLKKKIKPIQNGILEAISKVELKQFEFRKGDGALHFGAIAQDVQEAIGETKSEIAFKVPDKDGKPGKYYHLNYTEFLILRLAALEKRVKELENERSRV